MASLIRFILKSQLKRPKLASKTSGFTLIELLVAMILAVLVIAPLLGFMIDILGADRKEQAKAASEQEIQAALDFMARDLEQAVYIYDGDGIKAIKASLPTTGTPVLVFWKRQQIKNAFNIDNKACSAADVTAGNCNDSAVFSLVAYYRITSSDPNWSKNAARIARFEVKDGVADPLLPIDKDGKPKYLYASGDSRAPDDGFVRFDLNTSTGTLENKMNKWTADPTKFTNKQVVLVDYIDNSTGSSVPSAGDCKNVLGIPSTDGRTTAKLTTGADSSFYACVDSGANIAQIFIRGNSLARIQDTANYTASSPFFPTGTIKVKGRGFLYTE